MTTFKLRFFTERPPVTWDNRARCWRNPDGSWAGSDTNQFGKPNLGAKTAVMQRLKTDGFVIQETTYDGWRIYVSTAAPRKAPARVVSGFAAFCKRRVVIDTKPLTFVEALAREGIHLHPTGCWCPRHNQPKKARKAA